MLKPGGFVLTNILADKVPSQLKEAHRTTIPVKTNPQIIEHVFCYQRQP